MRRLHFHVQAHKREAYGYHVSALASHSGQLRSCPSVRTACPAEADGKGLDGTRFEEAANWRAKTTSRTASSRPPGSPAGISVQTPRVALWTWLNQRESEREAQNRRSFYSHAGMFLMNSECI